MGNVAALVSSHVNGLLIFESTIEQTTETMPFSHKIVAAAAMTTNRITSLQELLHYKKFKDKKIKRILKGYKAESVN